MARAIDADAVLDRYYAEFEKQDICDGSQDRDWLMRCIEEAPTLTPPNETPPCYQPDGDGCAYQCYDGQDEPIDKCKECPLCYSDKQRQHTPPNEWVAVEERLPGVSGNYICAVKDKNGSVWTIPAEWSLEMKMWIGAFGEIKNIVTHWMLLPAPPAKEDQK